MHRGLGNESRSKLTMISIEFLGAKDISERAYIGMLNLFPGVHDVNAALIDVAEAENALQIVDTVRLDMGRLVAYSLVAEGS